MAYRHEEIAELPVEDPLQSETALEALHGIAQARYKRDLRRFGGKITLALNKKEISVLEADVLFGELAAKNQQLRPQPARSPAEFPSEPPIEHSPQATADLPEGRHYDWAERAAGEYLDRE